MEKRFYIEAINSEAEKILNQYPVFQKQVLNEDIIHNISDAKGENHSELYHCTRSFIKKFRVYVNRITGKRGGFYDLFHTYVRSQKKPIQSVTL